MSESLPAVARLYYGGTARRRYKRASTRDGPGEPLCLVSVAEAFLARERALHRQSLLAALERAARAESLLRALVDACEAAPGSALAERITEANRFLREP